MIKRCLFALAIIFDMCSFQDKLRVKVTTEFVDNVKLFMRNTGLSSLWSKY